MHKKPPAFHTFKEINGGRLVYIIEKILKLSVNVKLGPLTDMFGVKEGKQGFLICG